MQCSSSGFLYCFGGGCSALGFLFLTLLFFGFSMTGGAFSSVVVVRSLSGNAITGMHTGDPDSIDSVMVLFLFPSSSYTVMIGSSPLGQKKSMSEVHRFPMDSRKGHHGYRYMFTLMSMSFR